MVPVKPGDPGTLPLDDLDLEGPLPDGGSIQALPKICLSIASSNFLFFTILEVL